MQPTRGLLSSAMASLLSPHPCPCHLPNPTSITSVNSHLLRGAFKGSDPEKAGAREVLEATASTQALRCTWTQHPTQSPPMWAREHLWELQQPAAPPGEVLGIRQLEDKGNRHACENSGAKAARDCLKGGVRAGCILWTLVGFPWEEGGRSKKPITETQ